MHHGDKVSELIARLELLPHPEGGYYKEVFRSDKNVIIDGEARGAICTTIYFLLPAQTFSALHKIRGEEQWFFLNGSPLNIYEFKPDGTLQVTELSVDNPWHCINPDNWFASRPAHANGYCLVCCVVAPGFNFDEFKLASYKAMQETFSQHDPLLRSLCIVD